MGYYQTLQSFDFSFLLKVFASVFQKSDSLFNILQKKVFDVSFYKQKINEFKKDLTALRESLDSEVWHQGLQRDREWLTWKMIKKNPLTSYFL
jgi:hypothetical protein